jgi:general secretion pathway protein G
VIGKFLENQSRKSKIAVHRLKSEKGFSLLELMITMFILIILISVAMPTYQRSVQNARETVLRENLWQMRRSIDQYAADKGKLPQSIEDLVEGKYLREVPVDPITEKAEWKTVQGEDPNSSDGEQGLTDVKSMADGEDSDGKKYEDY